MDNTMKEVADPSQGPSVSAGQIPDLLKIGSIPSNVQMDVDTDVLDPIIHSQTFVRFVLQNKGILHSHSKIQFAFEEQLVDSWLPMNIGIAGIIQRATLRVGNQTICEIDDFADYTSYRSQFMSSESMRERLQYQTGQCMAKKFAYNNEGDEWQNGPPVIVEPVAGGQYGGGGSLDLARGITNDVGRNGLVKPGQYFAEVENQRMPPYMSLFNSSAPTGNRASNTFQWALSDFFPFLKTNQLPLYMMKEQISLEFVLNPSISGGRAWVAQGGAAGTAYPLVTTETKMFADYQYYPQEMMVAYANANRNMQFSYVDYRLSKLTVPMATSGQQIRNIGGAGRIVSKIVWGLQNNTPTSATSPIIKWNATAMDRTAAMAVLPPIPPSLATKAYLNSAISQNVKYNGEFLYPINVNNTARCFHNVVQAEGLTPYCGRQEYSNEGNSLTRRTHEGHVVNDVFAGTAFWQASRLNKGERINSRGIELYYNVAMPNAASSPAVGTAYTLRVFLETIKFATLRDGFVQTQLA
jgi:hypothetical protein